MCKGSGEASNGYNANTSNGRPCVVVVDPYSTGGMLAAELDQRGYAVIALWTNDVGENLGHLPQAAKGFPEKFLAEVWSGSEMV